MASINTEWLRWLYWMDQGETVDTIMEVAERKRSTIYHGIQRAREYLQHQAELRQLGEGKILLLMLGVSGRECQHGRKTTFTGTMLCLDCHWTNNERRREFREGEPIIRPSKKSPPEFVPKGAKPPDRK